MEIFSSLIEVRVFLEKKKATYLFILYTQAVSVHMLKYAKVHVHFCTYTWGLEVDTTAFLDHFPPYSLR